MPSLRWSGACLSSLLPLLMFSSVLCVCPAHPLPFNPPFTMTIAACRDPLPCIAPTTAGYWQGPFHCLNPPWTIKGLAGLARPPCKQPTPHLLCLSAILSGKEAGELLGLCTLVLSGLKEEGLGFMFPIACDSFNGQENC